MPKDIQPSFPIEFIQIPPTNFRQGRGTTIPDLIVIHIAEGSKESVVSTFKDPHTEKSSHFLVNKDGTVTQFVSTINVAYGNGIVVNPISELVLQRQGINPNVYSISIEHEGFATQDITPAQYATTITLVKFLHEKWGIPLDRTHVIRHTEIEASKTCPGLINVEKIVQAARSV